MTSYLVFRGWVREMSPVAYSGLLVALVGVVALGVFGVVPHGNMDYVNAFLSGAVWASTIGILVLAGNRIDRLLTTACSVTAGGLTLTIPTIFVDASPVAWGTTLARVGFLLFVIWSAWQTYERIVEEKRS